MQQQNSGFGGFGSNGSSGATRFSAFGRPQQTPSASTSSAPPNTFFRPPSQGARPSAFSSGFNNGQQQNQQQQPGPAFGASQTFNAGPRPPFQKSSFGTPRPFNGGQQPRPQRPGFNAPRPAMNDQQSSSTFGSRPRPFTARPTGPGMSQDGGRPPSSNAFRGGRGGGSIRPIKPFASHTNANQQSASSFGSETGVEAGPSNQHAPRPRPRPFANKSTTFNTQPQQTAPTASFGAPLSNNQGSASTSAFGSGAASQNDASSSFNQPSSSFPPTQTQSGFGTSTSAFGSTTGTGNTAPATSAFGGAAKPSAGPTFGSTSSQPSAFASTAGPPASSSAFGGGSQGVSSFGGFSSAAPQPQPQTSVAPSTTSAPPPASNTNPPPASSAAPTSSFSNFLRKDRSGASTPGGGAATPVSSGGDNVGNAADEDELRKKRFEDAPKVGNRFLEMKGGREALRNAYIKSGVLPDPDKPTDLALAVKLVGTCQDMCPEFEREEREFQKELDPLELYPGTDRVDPRIAVKIYRRPAAGRELPLPEDVRPPAVLKRTLDYLFHDLLPADPNNPRFTQVQGFLWNRTRAVRQDFIVQSEGGPIAIECHERIARYHILCLHWRGGPGAEGWSEQQELEQLRKTMRSLIEFYDDNRRKSSASASATGSGAQQPSPNEAEFRAYNLLLHLRDPETLREAELLPGDIFRSPLVQTAINLRQLAQRSNNLEKRGQPRNTEATLNFFSKFFAELRKPSVNYLMACLAENSFSSVRIGAVKAMSKAYMAQHRGVPIERVQHVLGMDSAEQVVAMATHLGLELEYEGDAPVAVKIHRSATINEDKPLATPFSTTIVEAKRGSYTSADVVDGRASGARTQVGAQGPTPAATMTQAFGQNTRNGATPAFGAKTQQQSGSALGATTASSPFGQPQPQRDANQSSAFGSASPSKLSAAAASFTPTAFGGSSSGNKAANAFSSFSGFGNSDAKKTDSKPGLPSFGAFGKDASQAKQEPVAAPSPFGNKAIVSSTPPSNTQSKKSSLPSFSFGQPPAKDSSTASAAESTQNKPAPSFSFGSGAKTDSEPSKPAVPSFFSSSLAKQSPSDKKEPAPVAQVPSQPANAKQDSPPSASSALKRRASDPKENAAAQAAAAAKLDAEKKKAQSKSKQAARTYAVERAFQKLSDDVVRSLSEKVVARAVQAEEARRRAASRDELLARITDKLWQHLAEECAAEVAEEASRVAAADVFRSRSCAMRAWTRWAEVLQERRDREQQRQRLEEIRGEIRRRNILGRVQADATPSFKAAASKTSSHSDETSPIRHAFSIRQALLTGERSPASTTTPRLKRKLDDELVSPRASLHDDAELTDRWTRVRRQRSQLWAEGSLLHRLADHIEELLLHFRPAELDRLVVLYSGAPGQHVASSWLRVKFGFGPAAPSRDAGSEVGRDVLEIDLADGSQLELVDVTPADKGGRVDVEAVLPDLDKHSQPGLVVFETSPGIAQAETGRARRRVLAEDRRRLEEVARSELVKGSQLACRLLVVSWGSADVGSERVVPADGDVEMSDVDSAPSNGSSGREESLLAALGVDPTKAIRSQPSAAPRLTSHTKPSPVLARAFDRVGVLELTDASVSIETTLSALLTRAMPDFTPNLALHLSSRRRSTLEDVALELYDQWARTSALLFDLLSGLPPPLLSAGADGAMTAKVDQLACKTLQILTALANHIVHTVLSLSETILEDDNAAEVRRLELPPPAAAPGDKLVGMALSQLDQLGEDEGEAEHKLHLRASLVSSLRGRTDLAHVLGVVNRTHIDALFRYSLEKLGRVWIGVRPESAECGEEWREARERLARLCGAAVDEVAAEAREVWAAYRAQEENGMVGREEASKRFRVEREDEEMEEVRNKGGKVDELRALIAQTRRFLDTPPAHT